MSDPATCVHLPTAFMPLDWRPDLHEAGWTQLTARHWKAPDRVELDALITRCARAEIQAIPCEQPEARRMSPAWRHAMVGSMEVL